MRIMQINSVSGVMSTGRAMKEMAVSLQKRGHITSVVYSEGTLDYSEGYHMSNAIDKKLHALLSRLTGLVGYYSRNETKKLLRYLDEWKPELVRLGNLHSNFINIPLLLEYLGSRSIATVITLDDCFWYTGKCCHYTIASCDKWKKECGSCPKVHSDNISWFFDKTGEMLRDKRVKLQGISRLAVIGVSNWITNQAAQSILSNAFIRQTIYNWINIDLFKPVITDYRERLGLGRRFVILGVSAYWAKSKGLDDFLKLSRLIDEDTIILLVGDFREKIEMPNNIIAIPRTNSAQELAEYYSVADAFFNPSEEESFGKVTAEALACGTPVVVYDTTACPELVHEGCGAIVPLHNIYTAVNALNRIKAEGKDKYSSNCREFAVSHFEESKCIKEYISVFEELVS